VEDPYVPADAIAKLGFTKGSKLEEHDVLIIAVSHAEFAALTPGDLVASLSKNGIVYDLKSIWNPISIESLGYRYLCL
jgi:UDP-N-acetyl-D-mannosaminuronate dehydrogenase